MTNKKQKYILSSAAVLAVGFASALGTMNIVNNLTPRSLALEDLPHCTNVQMYEKWAEYNHYSTVSSPINLTEDTIASYDIPNQTERCKVEINLNGHTLSEAYYDRYSTRSTIDVGNNAVVIVNGDGGTLAYGSPVDPELCTTYEDGLTVCRGESQPILGGSAPVLNYVTEGGELYLNDVNISSYGDSVYNYRGTVVANNVTANNSMWNSGGNLIINSGDYQSISAQDNATTTINGGTFRFIRAESGSTMILNDGALTGGTIKSYKNLYNDNRPVPDDETISPTFDITINGGNYENANIYSPVTITGGDFENVSIKHDPYAPAEAIAADQFIEGPDGTITINHTPDPVVAVISGGNFSNSTIAKGSEISGGTFDNTTFTRDTTISDGSFENSTINNYTTITGGSFENTTIPGNATITNGSFVGSSITNSNSEISGGSFKATNISRSADISGGSFDNIPAATNVVADKKVIENEDGSYSVVDEDAPGEEPIPQCEIRIYTDENTFTTYTGSITLTEDTIASYEVDDQSGICRFTINLNGKKLTSVDNKEAISIGSNVSAKINGENGTIEQSNTNNPESTEPAPAAIAIKDEGAASIKDVTIATNSEENPGISNSGKATLSNVNAGENTNIENNDGGELIINSGDYKNITTTDSGGVTVNGGKVEEVIANNSSEVTINDGDFTGSTITSTESDPVTGATIPSTESGNVTVNGGTFENSTINSASTINEGNFTGATINAPANVTDGSFENTDFNGQTNISGGDFSGTNINGQSEISGGNFDNSSINGQSEISGGSFENSNITAPATISDGTFTGTTVSDESAISGGNFDGSEINGQSTITDGNFENSNINGQTDISGGTFENSNITAPATITDGNFTGTTVTDNSEISGGSFENSTISGDSEISGGSFENSNISGQSNITDGNFTGTTLSDNTEISGGSFDTRPSEDSLPTGAEVIEHDDGTFEIRSPESGSTGTTETPTETPTETETPAETPAETVPEEEAIKTPNTGGFLASETGGKQFFIGAILAVEGAILAICGYVLHRLYKNYRVDFRRK